jgi:NTE family protein
MASYKIGAALSGGFIKGFAHLGVYQALLEHDIKPEIIAGVSAGALAGAFLADGREPYQCLECFKGHNTLDFTKIVIPKTGFFKLNSFIDFLKETLTAKKIEDLKIPMFIVATDLDHGKSVIFRKGGLAERIAASCSMPVMFTPQYINGTYYVDGGVLQNLPVSVIRKECDKIVAINVSPMETSDYKKNLASIAYRSYQFMFRANTLRERESSDLLIEPAGLREYGNREMDKADRIFKQGYDCANEEIKRRIAETGTIWK